MEISGAVLNRSSIASIHRRLLVGRSDGAPKCVITRVRVPARASCGGAVFCDEGHLQYYEEGRSKQDKKRAKLIKTLKKDLSELYAMGSGVPTDKSDKIQEAAKQLLEQLNQIKVEEMEMLNKRKEEQKEMKKKKEEKKAACKMDCKEDSSSSSSESSESGCEEPEILQLSDLKTSSAATINVPNRVSSVPEPFPLPLPAPLSLPVSASASVLIQAIPVEDVPPVKIEVCMGGKCKKAGSMELLNEFEKKVGGEGGAVVVGCKCMGKCKEGPNLRVSSRGSGTTDNVQEGESVRVLRDQLCIGVGLDDVGTIAAHFFGKEEGSDAGSLITM